MNILVTGGGGQLGAELVKILSKGKKDLGEIPKSLQNANVISVDHGTLDISDADSVRAYFSHANFDIILNCAAMTNVDACETDAESAMKTNAIGARNLAHAANAGGCKLAHVSTDYVFSGKADKPYREWDIPMPNTVYGKSKLLGEQYIREVCPRSFVIRTAWLYGHSGGNFVKTILRLAQERSELKVVDDQRGSPTNAADLAYHILKIVEGDFYGVYHCVGRGECSWYDFACEIVRLADIPCKISPCSTDEFPRPAPRPAYSVLDNLMLRCTVGDEMRDWKDALAAFITTHKNGEIA